MKYDVTDFETQVVERSRVVPVVVDFWAQWCSPCRVLGPVLEKLSEESDGRWDLAKVDTDMMPETAMQYGVRSIPAVKLFIDGRVVSEFVGAQPEHAVRKWLDTYIPPVESKETGQAEILLSQGKTTQARKILQRILEEDPADDRARVLLARSWLSDDPRKAAEIVSPIEPGSKYEEIAEAVRTYADLLATDENTLPDAPVRPLFVQALRAYRAGDFDEALEKFIEVIRRDRWYHEDAARKACISVFKLLGEDHEITLRHRKDFNRSLY